MALFVLRFGRLATLVIDEDPGWSPMSSLLLRRAAQVCFGLSIDMKSAESFGIYNVPVSCDMGVYLRTVMLVSIRPKLHAISHMGVLGPHIQRSHRYTNH